MHHCVFIGIVLIHTEYSFKQAIDTITIMGGADFSQRCIAQIRNKSAGVIFRCTTLRSVRRKAAVAIVICHGTDSHRYPRDLLLIKDCFVCCVLHYKRLLKFDAYIYSKL